MGNWLFSNKSFYFMGLSLALLGVGYALLAKGPVNSFLSTSAAPVILVAVYCGLIPYALLRGYGKGGGKVAKK